MGRGSGREDWHLLLKIIIIGDAGAGKSCLLHSFLENHNFLRNSSHTVGVEFGSKIVEVGGKRIKLQIWDTAGQERFKSVTKSYFRGAAGAIIVYDVTSKESFSHVMSWLAEARQLASPGIVGVVAGNKSDLQESREVTFLEGSSLAQSNELIFLESSALSGVSVDEIFLKCALRVLNKYEAGELDLKQVSIVSSGVASSTGDGRLMVGRAGEKTSSSCSC